MYSQIIRLCSSNNIDDREADKVSVIRNKNDDNNNNSKNIKPIFQAFAARVHRPYTYTYSMTSLVAVERMLGSCAEKNIGYERHGFIRYITLQTQTYARSFVSFLVN